MNIREYRALLALENPGQNTHILADLEGSLKIRHVRCEVDGDTLFFHAVEGQNTVIAFATMNWYENYCTFTVTFSGDGDNERRMRFTDMVEALSANTLAAV